MKHLSRIKSLASVIFVAAMITAWPTIAPANEPGGHCIEEENYFGIWWHDPNFPALACMYAWNICDSWCTECHGSSCFAIDWCSQGYGVVGQCE